LTSLTQNSGISQILETLREASPVVLVSEEGAPRTLFLIEVVEQALKERKRVLYVDFDTAFTNFLPKHLLPIENSSLLEILVPEPQTVVTSMMELFSLREADLIVVDSVSTLYHILNASFGRAAGHIMGLFIALVAEVASRCNSTLIFTSFVRLKKLENPNRWVPGFSGGRVLRLQSKEFLLLKNDGGRNISARSLNQFMSSPRQKISSFTLHVDHDFAI
jgi:predicted ATP-dependent serine protease